MSEPDQTLTASPGPLPLVFACLAWTPIPIGWALIDHAIPRGDVLEMNETLAMLGLLVGAAGVVTAIVGIVIAVRAARRRHPRPRGAIAFAIAGNAIALGTVLVPTATMPFQHAHGAWIPEAGAVRHPIADRQSTLADRLVGPGTDFTWSGMPRPSAVAWHDGTLVASVGRNGIVATTADGTELWRRRLVRRPDVRSCSVRGLAVDAFGDAVASCGPAVVAVAGDGSDVWSRRFDGYVVRGLVSDASGRVYVYARPRHATNLDTMVTRPDLVVALSATGAVRWRGPIGRLGAIRRYSDGSELQIAAAAPAPGGGVVVATKDNVIDLAADGSRRWHLASKDYPVEVNALLTGRDGTVYVAGSGDQGFVQAVSGDGAVQWTATTGPAVQAIALGPDGVLYALTWANLFEYSTH